MGPRSVPGSGAQLFKLLWNRSLVRRLDALAARMKTNGEGCHSDGGSVNVDEVKGRLHVLLEKVAV